MADVDDRREGLTDAEVVGFICKSRAFRDDFMRHGDSGGLDCAGRMTLLELVIVETVISVAERNGIDPQLTMVTLAPRLVAGVASALRTRATT